MALVVIKVLSANIDHTIAMYASLLQLPFCLVAAASVGSGLTRFAVIALIAFFGTMTCYVWLRRSVKLTLLVVLPVDFTKLVFAGLAGWLFFSGELPGIWIWVGGTGWRIPERLVQERGDTAADFAQG